MSTPETQKILEDLRRPFSENDVRIKLQTATVAVLYLDARLVIDRLNQVCGLDWSDDYTATTGGLLCKLTVCGTTRQDVGLAGDGPQGNSQKAILSDALKRAAVKFGVGLSVYAAPVHRLTEADVWLKKDGKPGGLKDAAERRIRVDYGRWVASQGAHFGAPLAAGFEAGSAGDLVDEASSARGEVEERPTFIEPEVAPHPPPINEDGSVPAVETVKKMLKELIPEERKAVKLAAARLDIPWNANTALALHDAFGSAATTRDGILAALNDRITTPPVGEADGEIPLQPGDAPLTEEEQQKADEFAAWVKDQEERRDATAEQLAGAK